MFFTVNLNFTYLANEYWTLAYHFSKVGHLLFNGLAFRNSTFA